LVGDEAFELRVAISITVDGELDGETEDIASTVIGGVVHGK
jgi:hypothetical protein